MDGKPLDPITDIILTNQRRVMDDCIDKSTPLEIQRKVAEELLWHAMFTVSYINPDCDMKRLAQVSRSAIEAGIKAAGSTRDPWS